MSAPPLAWANGYSFGYSGAHPHAGVETSDGGILMVGDGQEWLNMTVRRHILILKTNSSGATQWKLRLGSCGYNYGKYGIELADKTYLVAGALCGGRADGAAGTALRRTIFRLGPDGQILYVQEFPNSGEAEGRRDVFMALSHTVDQGNTVLTTGTVGGENETTGYVDETMFLLYGGKAFITKLSYAEPDKPLQVVFEKLLVVPNATYEPSQGMRVFHNSHADQYAMALAVAETPGNFQFGAAAFNLEGEMLWSNMYVAASGLHDGHESHPYTMVVPADGSGYLIGGLAVHYDPARVEQCQGRLIKVGTDGIITFDRRFQAEEKDTNIECYGVDNTIDGGVIMTCGIGVKPDLHPEDSTQQKTWMVLMHRTDAHGNTLWTANYSTNVAPFRNNAGEFVLTTRNGDYMVFVDSQTYGNRTTGGNFGLMLLGADRAEAQAKARMILGDTLGVPLSLSGKGTDEDRPTELLRLDTPVSFTADAAEATVTGWAPRLSRRHQLLAARQRPLQEDS